MVSVTVVFLALTVMFHGDLMLAPASMLFSFSLSTATVLTVPNQI
jgi:hypothetical protein